MSAGAWRTYLRVRATSAAGAILGAHRTMGHVWPRHTRASSGSPRFSRTWPPPLLAAAAKAMAARTEVGGRATQRDALPDE
jgi:hypothetical protein